MRLISPGHAARIYNTTTATLARWRRRGTGPAYFRLTPLVIRYATDDLHDWFTNPGQPAPTPPPASPTQAPDRQEDPAATVPQHPANHDRPRRV